MTTNDADVTFDGRTDERFETSWLVEIAHPSLGKLQVAARDVSRTGARLAIPQDIVLPETFAFRIVGKNFLVRARMVWRRGHYVGIVVEGTAPMPDPSSKARKVPSLGVKGREVGGPVLGARPLQGVRERHNL